MTLLAKFLLSCLFVCSAAAASGQGPVRPQRAAANCSSEGFAEEISRAETWYRIFEIKRRSGYLPPEPMRRQMEGQIKVRHERFLAGLRRLSNVHPTYALIFGSDADSPCVWLVGPDGVLSSGVSQARTSVPQRIWQGLEVTARSRAPRSPRAPNGNCPPPEVVPYEAPSPEFLRAAQGALREAATAMLPPEMLVRLEAVGGPDSRLLIVPTGNLRKIPFAALPLGEGMLIDRFAPVILPSVQAVLSPSPVGAAPAPLSGAERLIIGNPDLTDDRSVCWTDLPAAEREAKQVATITGGGVLLTGKDANRAEVINRLTRAKDRFQLVYFATHGVSDPENPADGSFLALAGGHLRGADLRRLSFAGAPLVVMSACQTGLGKDFDQGVFGLPEAWHYAGARKIVMSLWDVDDAGTETLMTDFVARLTRRNWGGTEFALAEAMRAMKAKDADPMIWAAFSYHGDPSS